MRSTQHTEFQFAEERRERLKTLLRSVESASANLADAKRLAHLACYDAQDVESIVLAIAYVGDAYREVMSKLKGE